MIRGLKSYCKCKDSTAVESKCTHRYPILRKIIANKQDLWVFSGLRLSSFIIKGASVGCLVEPFLLVFLSSCCGTFWASSLHSLMRLQHSILIHKSVHNLSTKSSLLNLYYLYSNMATRAQFESSNEIGVFSNLTNAYCLTAIGGSENFYSVFEQELADHIPVIHTSISGCRFVGRVTVGKCPAFFV